MDNPYIIELLARIDRRFNVDSATMSLGDWICENTTLRGQKFSFSRYPFQKAIADDLHPNIDVIKPSQIGLALALGTPLPTPEGWTTMGEVKVGDKLFNEQGKPCKVTYISPIYTDHDCYEVEFDTGEVIIADANHRWYVESEKAFCEEGLYPHPGRIPKGSPYGRSGVVSTRALKEMQESYDTSHSEAKNLFTIPNTTPLELPEMDLPIDPYLLGLWLGDGSNASATLTAVPEDKAFYQEELARRGYEVICKPGYSFAVNIPGSIKNHRTWKDGSPQPTLYAHLSSLNLLGNKHIPPQYLRASKAARLDLVRGLLDTDGSITKAGRLSFHNCSPLLVEGFKELLHSLGLKTRTRWRKPSTGTLKNGYEIRSKQMIAEISTVAYVEDDLFLLPRKRSRQKLQALGKPTKVLRRRIVAIRPTARQPVRCLTVDSEKHLFLAGRGMIPTHNTEVQIRKTLSFAARYRGTTSIFTLPTDIMMKRTSTTRIKPIIEEDKCFNLETRTGEKPARSMGLYQIGSSFVFVTGATEGAATSISADAVFNDELDLSDQKMIALFNSRLQNSDWKISQRFSTPTFTNFAIDKGFQASDQHEYLCRCPACNHWQAPLFRPQFIHIPGLPEDLNDLTEIDETMIDNGLDLLNAYVKCEKCSAPLPLGDTDYREWVPRFPMRDHHRGFRVSPFSTDRLDVKYVVTQLLKYKDRDFIRGWYNTVLGEAYTDGSSRLSDADINACFTGTMSIPDVDPHRATWIGIDMGQTCHAVVAQGETLDTLRCVRFASMPIAQLRGWVEEMLATYNVIGGACDRHPYTPNADELRDISDGKIVPVEYRGQKPLNFIMDEVTESVTHVQANRTRAADAVARAVRRKLISFSGYGSDRSIITDHLKDMVRDENPEVEAKWVKLTGNDHYFHALIFLLLGVSVKDTFQHLFTNPRSSVNLVPVTVPMPSKNLTRQ